MKKIDANKEYEKLNEEISNFYDYFSKFNDEEEYDWHHIEGELSGMENYFLVKNMDPDYWSELVKETIIYVKDRDFWDEIYSLNDDKLNDYDNFQFAVAWERIVLVNVEERRLNIGVFGVWPDKVLNMYKDCFGDRFLGKTKEEDVINWYTIILKESEREFMEKMSDVRDFNNFGKGFDIIKEFSETRNGVFVGYDFNKTSFDIIEKFWQTIKSLLPMDSKAWTHSNTLKFNIKSYFGYILFDDKKKAENFMRFIDEIFDKKHCDVKMFCNGKFIRGNE